MGGFAYAVDPDAFVVEVNPSTFEPGESVDVIVKAVTADGNVVTDFLWIVIIDVEEFLDQDSYDVPADSLYTFVAEDQWVKTFSKWFTIRETGTYTLKVSDINFEAEWFATVIVGADPEDLEDLQDVEISSPASGSILSDATIAILGQTDGARIPFQVFINNEKLEEEGETDLDGRFTLYVTSDDLDDWDNRLQIKLLDFQWNLIGQSEEIGFTYNAPVSDGVFQSLSVSPWTTFEVGDKGTFSVQVDPDVNNVELRMEALWTFPLDKTSDDTFSKEILLDRPGEFLVSVNIILDGWERRSYPNQAAIEIENDVVLENFKIAKDALSTDTVTLSWDVTGEAEEYEVSFGTSRNNFTDTETTSNTTVTIGWLQVGETYFFQVQAFDDDEDEIGEPSPIQSITMNQSDDTTQWAAPTCLVVWLRIFTEKIGDRYYLTRNPVQGATSYEVFRSEFMTDSIQDMQRIGETTENRFAYPFDPFAAQDEFAYYAIQARCSDGTNVKIGATQRVKVWPVQDMFLLFVITLLIYSLFRLYSYSTRK